MSDYFPVNPVVIFVVHEDYTMHGLDQLPEETKVNIDSEVTLGDLRRSKEKTQ